MEQHHAHDVHAHARDMSTTLAPIMSAVGGDASTLRAVLQDAADAPDDGAALMVFEAAAKPPPVTVDAADPPGESRAAGAQRARGPRWCPSTTRSAVPGRTCASLVHSIQVTLAGLPLPPRPSALFPTLAAVDSSDGGLCTDPPPSFPGLPPDRRLASGRRRPVAGIAPSAHARA